MKGQKRVLRVMVKLGKSDRPAKLRLQEEGIEKKERGN